MTGSTTVHVSNIAHTTSEKEVRDFFSFCGKITSLTLTPSSADPDSTLSATVTFERDSAAKTALLLDGTKLGHNPVKVESTHSLDEIASGHVAESGDTDAPNFGTNEAGDVRQEDKPRTAILAEYLSHGYVVGDGALQKGMLFSCLFV
jgi:RNA recognition motif-containing protein